MQKEVENIKGTYICMLWRYGAGECEVSGWGRKHIWFPPIYVYTHTLFITAVAYYVLFRTILLLLCS